MGGASTTETKRQLDMLQKASMERPFAICATGKYIGEGFDEPRLDTLFLTMPISWEGTLAQYVGRLHRLHEAKHDVRVYDYIDNSVEMLVRMYQKRLKGYAAIGYQACGNHELSYTDSDMIYDQTSFQERFLQDMGNAQQNVVIVSPFVTIHRVRWLEGAITELLTKGVNVTVMSRSPTSLKEQNATTSKDAINALRELNVSIQIRDNIYQKYAIIDDSITWYGSINLLGFGASQESIMRLASSSVANALRV